MRGERLGGEIERRHLVQRAIGLAAPARGAHVIVDERVSHRVSDSVAVSRKELPRSIRSTKKRPVASLPRPRRFRHHISAGDPSHQV